MTINIGKIRGTLEACVLAKDALYSSVRVYDDAKILVDAARDAWENAERVFRAAARAAQAQLDEKLRTAEELEQGLEDLIADIRSSKNIKKRNALETCLAIRALADKTAQRVDRIRSEADDIANLSSIADAAMAVASQELTDKRRIYDDAVSAAQSAKRSILAISRIRL